MDLIVCEKPSAARDMASALGAKWDAKENLFRSGRANIAVLRGHLLRLKGLKESNPTFEATWDRSILVHLPAFPNLHDREKYAFNSSDAKLIQTLKRHFLNQGYKRIVNATDPGREGELLFWELYDYFGATTPVLRFWESEALSHEVVLRGLDNLKGTDFYGARRSAAYARQHADWYVGMNLTIAYTAASGMFLSVGTVQTPTLALVVRRDETIENWKGEKYHEISVGFDGFTAKYKPDNPYLEDRPFSLDQPTVTNMLSELKQAENGIVQSLQISDVTVLPPKPFSLTTLQIKANQKYGLTGDQTLKIAQKLYEEFKCLSYPRTDSEVVGESMKEQVNDIAAALSKTYDISFSAVHFTRHNVNNEKLTDHHALIPLKPIPDAASEQEKQIYRLVLERFFEAFSESGKDRKAKVIIQIDGHLFESTGRNQHTPGWRALFAGGTEDEEAEPSLPALFHLKEKQEISITDAPKAESKKMEPPKRYTEAELYKSMKNIANSIEDKALREAMKDVDGRLATPATQAATIELLVKRGYIARKGKQLISTVEGRTLIHTVAPELSNVIQRAKMEQLLNDFEHPKSVDEYMRDVRELVEANVRFCFEVKEEETIPTIEVDCPNCQKSLMTKRFQYACGSCDFAIPRYWGHYMLSLEDVRRLVDGQMTEVHTFKSKDKSKTFQAAIQLEDGQVKYHFPSREELSFGPCPMCSDGGVMYPRGKVLACTKCSYVLFRSIAGKELTDHQLKKLLISKSTPVIKGFQKKDKTKFDSALFLGTDGKVSFTKPR
ncbi:type IA DNA topoisomerase [Alicyclobacillus fodiniaquatilis]|uniref:DNA topoisomerase n=1 Tax=Alicyclobacillus fodiniaquatilis TaxID=1661150 RepID=A0ABW4JCM4_9BACL